MENRAVGSFSKTNPHDNTNELEQPSKKARYIWQLKGKYHLKDKGYEESELVEEKQDVCENDENCGRCYIKGLLAHSENAMSYDDSSEEECQKNIDKSICDEIPVTLVKPNIKNHDYYLQRWQARQVAKGYMDNTINRVLETYMFNQCIDASDLVEDCGNDDQVEDEGILMAIQSHGLQSADNNWNGLNTKWDNEIESNKIEEFALDNYQNIHNEMLKSKITDENNFLEAAVSVAIQKKGLSSQNCV
ncbi:hypothetical protein FQA39_LY16691 [Lamprigera yunnana]|nr:hypothetical protein FQA39_LY16691 [Lamprigera yunnana]